jgi:hypothetical protein
VSDKPLEPTGEQVRACMEAQLAAWGYGTRDDLTEGYARTVRLLWPVIRDQVLEAAARECESIRSAGALEGAFEAGARAAASVIRDMKGTVVAHQVEQRAWPTGVPGLRR